MRNAFNILQLRPSHRPTTVTTSGRNLLVLHYNSVQLSVPQNPRQFLCWSLRDRAFFLNTRQSQGLLYLSKNRKLGNYIKRYRQKSLFVLPRIILLLMNKRFWTFFSIWKIFPSLAWRLHRFFRKTPVNRQGNMYSIIMITSRCASFLKRTL